MAERRMYAKTIVLSDAFLDMPLSARCLYFTLGMVADDDGFVNSPKSVMRQCGASQDDMNILISKKFVLIFESGVVVIKHWRIHNYIQNDRYIPTKYKDEKECLTLDENKSYTLKDECIQNGYNLYTQDRLGKDRLVEDRIGKDSIGEDNIIASASASAKPSKHKYGEFQHVLLTDDEHERLIHDYGIDKTTTLITYLDEYIEMKGYKAKNHNLAIRKWVVDAVDREDRQKKPQEKSLIDKLWEV